MGNETTHGRFGFSQILEAMAQLRAHGPDLPDRRAALNALVEQFETSEDILLERGFDKAYRRLVEGV